MIGRYTFKLYPTPEQDAVLRQHGRMVAELWNAFLEMQETRYSRMRGQRGVTHVEGKSVFSFFDFSSAITRLRHECPEWEALSVWTAHRVARAVVNAYEGFFRRAKAGAGKQAGRPRFRRTATATWVPCRFASGCKLTHCGGLNWHLRIKAVPGVIRARGKFPAAPLEWKEGDLRWRDGAWWFSVCVEMPDRWRPGFEEVMIRFDLLDCFAEVNGEPVTADDIGIHPDPVIEGRIVSLQRQMSLLRDRQDWGEYRLVREERGRMMVRAKRRRHEQLHKWTTGVVRRASSLTIVRPVSIREATASGRGSARDWGAAIKEKAEFNRHVLSQAPSKAIEMLRYKAKWAGIPVNEIESEELSVGNEMVRARKAVRRLRREINRQREIA